MDTGKLIVYLEFISLLIFIVFMIFRYSERNRSQITLATVLIVWISLFGSRMVYSSLNPCAFCVVPQDGVMSLDFSALVSGLIAFVTLVVYPIYTIDPKLMRSKAAILTLVPICVAIISYVIYHKMARLPINQSYAFDEIWALRGSVTVIWRFTIALIFMATITFSCWSIWSIIPSYEGYIQKNYANPSYNITWIRTFILGLYCISGVYFLQLFYSTLFTWIIYAIVAGTTFIVIADNAIRQKSAALPDCFSVDWDFRRGWYCIQTDEDRERYMSLDLIRRFYEWIATEKPYLATDFSLSRVRDEFPMLTYTSLDSVLQQDGHTFQSYVRKCRIDESIRLMEADSQLSYKQIGYMVGFSHYSSFCRAFIAEKGVSPTHVSK